MHAAHSSSKIQTGSVAIACMCLTWRFANQPIINKMYSSMHKHILYIIYTASTQANSFHGCICALRTIPSYYTYIYIEISGLSIVYACRWRQCSVRICLCMCNCVCGSRRGRPSVNCMWFLSFLLCYHLSFLFFYLFLFPFLLFRFGRPWTWDEFRVRSHNRSTCRSERK